MQRHSAIGSSPNLPRSQSGKRLGFAAIALTFAILANPISPSAKRLWVPVPVQKSKAMEATTPSLQDVKRGAEVFARCNACHAVGGSADTAIGPHLDGIVGRRAAAVAGYEYSADLTKA
ncbi:MAG: c-type cytochrome, partial [Pseudomonadota bacterium]